MTVSCPYKMSNPQLTSHYYPYEGRTTEQDWGCEEKGCALWNEHFGMCSLAVPAYLKGIDISKIENR